MLRDKKIKAECAKGGALAGYTEAPFGGDRPLSDDEWQGRLTAREIHSHLAAAYGAGVAGDKDAKEVRRIARRLGIRLDEDQRGRKLMGPRPKNQELKRPRGRPREKPEIDFRADTASVEAEQAKAPRTPIGEASYGWRERNRRELELSRRVIKSIDREIKKLTMLRGGSLGRYCY